MLTCVKECKNEYLWHGSLGGWLHYRFSFTTINTHPWRTAAQLWHNSDRFCARLSSDYANTIRNYRTSLHRHIICIKLYTNLFYIVIKYFNLYLQIDGLFPSCNEQLYYSADLVTYYLYVRIQFIINIPFTYSLFFVLLF